MGSVLAGFVMEFECGVESGPRAAVLRLKHCGVRDSNCRLSSERQDSPRLQYRLEKYRLRSRHHD